MARKWKKIKKVGGKLNKLRKNPLVNAGLGAVVPGYAQTTAVLDQVNAMRKTARESGVGELSNLNEDMKSYAIPRMMDSPEVQGSISSYADYDSYNLRY